MADVSGEYLLRVYKSPQFQTCGDQDFEIPLAGPFYVEIPCKAENGEIFVPSFEILSTTDAEVVE